MVKREISLRRKVGSIIILLFCAFVAICVTAVMLIVYTPDQNSLGALGSVCIDVISMIVLAILILNLTFEMDETNKTTKLFLALMMMTMLALFFDFLTWALDGSLAFGKLNYMFVASSLCMGAVLAGFFVKYLSYYMDDMYNLKVQHKSANICVILNIFAFVITWVLALTHTAFTFVDGHYEVGELYDFVLIIPILTILCIAYYAIKNVKTISIHDLIAVIGYILFMIAGALVESIYSIGTSYVSIALADTFIFVMLQNKLLDRVKKQREELAEEITSQYRILNSIAGIYSYVNYIDFEERTVRRFDSNEGITEQLDMVNDPHSSLNKRLFIGIEDEQKDKFWAYTDLSTVVERLGKEKIISAEFCHEKDGWFRAQYIRIGESADEPISSIIYAIRNIDEEKKNVEKWIRKSNTDELTGFYNRHAYEDEIALIESDSIKDNFVYVSIDVNGLKMVNDTFGHAAGDEMLVGACECMKQCFELYGKLYRTGGDEFAALIYADDVQLEAIRKDVEEVTERWSGKLIKSVAISCGYVSKKEAEDMTVHQMAILADKRMYEAKAKYYKMNGIDRRFCMSE